ncbi:MAG TPA: FAD-dependent thymidylate synthase [Methanosarcina sp.]|nr:FAD-dependent thymidylate synthase [Methanosarcina sp.]
MQIFVHSEPNAEDNAALQAWYSRSNKSVLKHLEKLSTQGSGKFMDQIFIQYGHASVGDLGVTTVYLEGISMLAAKAIEDTPLFNGQECSSRYIDFSTVEYALYVGQEEDPNKAVLMREVQEDLRRFYVSSLPIMEEHIKAQFPIKDGEAQSIYDKAVKARVFDILRAFLPCGATTNVAWSGTLRTMKERLELLLHHPLREVRLIAARTYEILYEKYPHSFLKPYADLYHTEAFGAGIEQSLLAMEETEDHRHMSKLGHFYSDILINGDPEDMLCHITYPETLYIKDTGDIPADYMQLLSSHPRRKAPTRHDGSREHHLDIEGVIDFGAFRDLQRHRAGYCSMPVVDAHNGFHAWPFMELTEDLQAEAVKLLDKVKSLDSTLIDENQCAQQRIDNQYFMPMGMLVPFRLSYDIGQAIYVAELRSGQTVHPTLRPIARGLGTYLKGLGAEVHFDDRDDGWSTRRGTQDIVEKAAVAA